MIFGKNIRLRPLERDDILHYVEWFADPEVCQYLETYMGFSAAQEQAWYDTVLRQPMEEQPLAIDVRVRGGKWRHVGSISLQHFQWRPRSAEFGIIVGDKRFWDKGVGTDAMRTILRHGFETLNLNRIYLRVHAGNARGIRVYERGGFKFEGTMREADYREGKPVDVHVYSILRREWDALHGAKKEKKA